ncbi:MAG: PAS domain-containing protein [Chloroflexi bacterium]|nr:PAS domain-containing protein [Chloroflexota bacterium]
MIQSTDWVVRLEQKNAELALIADLFLTLGQTLDAAVIRSEVLGVAFLLTGAQRVRLAVRHNAGWQIAALRDGAEVTVETDLSTLAQRLIREARPIALALDCPGEGPNCQVGVPLLHRGSVVGALEAEGLPAAERLDDHLHALGLVAGAASLALENARLHEDVLQANERLDAERERLAVTLTSIGDGVIATDTEGRIVLMNRVAEHLTGWTQGEALGRPLTEVFQIVNARTRQPSENPVEKVLVSGAVTGLPNDTALIAGDGGERLIDDSAAPILDKDGSILGAILVFRDATERRQAEQALRASEEHFRLAVDNSPDYVFRQNLDLRYTWVSKAAPPFTPEELLGKTDFELFHREEAERVTAIKRRVLETGVGIATELSASSGGEKQHFEIAIEPWRDRDGRITGIGGYARNITKRKRAEEERDRLTAQLELRAAELDAANRELDAFASAAAHDLRAPLARISGFSKIFLEDYGHSLDERGKDLQRRVADASLGMAQLVDGLLKLARLGCSELHPRSIDLSELAKEIVTDLKETAPERQVEFIIAPKLVAEADPQLLRAALENLLGNAWKYTSKHAQAKIEFGTTVCEDCPVYFVRDDGAGFDTAYADRLFNAFQRLHSSSEFGGTGVGLATVHRIVLRHGGRIWAEGAVEQGATFYFTLQPGPATKGARPGE